MAKRHFGRRRGNNQRGNHWEAYSPKVQRIVEFQSTPEYLNWLSVEADPEIVGFKEQPGLFQIGKGEGRLITRPDMFVLYRDGRRELREVKTLEELHEAAPRVLRQLAALKACSEANGINYRVVHSGHLRELQVQLQNWQLGVSLITRKETDNERAIRLFLEDAIRIVGACCVGQLANLGACSEGDIFRHVFRAAHGGRIRTDLDRNPMTRRTLLWVS
ncbi:TnsA endonuclease N terminal [Verrucomicrobium sp. GAS474]|uniref:TnsA endonuclease N-terminal domain-containing protein n=1 Tax=Verrucomicrobium sp. GAS474 TaxID=1882831 RepID=UPI00087B7646|nr:TnsA endonuclease N-terminal domain-containing protein [Verrucomicrobium sp. GAS474]SDU18282.1 TnsA endonuclease N terminal [Verrucomicrobium sp. GAS474]